MKEIQTDGKITEKMKYCTIGPGKQGHKKITILGIVSCGCEIRFLTLQEGHITLKMCVKTGMHSLPKNLKATSKF
jgi:hypothetical protein